MILHPTAAEIDDAITNNEDLVELKQGFLCWENDKSEIRRGIRDLLTLSKVEFVASAALQTVAGEKKKKRDDDDSDEEEQGSKPSVNKYCALAPLPVRNRGSLPGTSGYKPSADMNHAL